MPRPLLWLIPWLALACAPALPSTTPLGEGPMVKAEAALVAKEDQARAAKGKTAGAPPAATPPDDPAPPAAPQDEPAAPPPDKPVAEAPKPEPAGAKPQPGKKPGAVTIVYAGEYVGSDTSAYKLEGRENTEKDDKARTKVEGTGPDINVTFIDSGNGKDICTLKAKMNGKTGTFAAGQKCWGDGPGMSGTLTKGTIAFDDKKLTIDASFDIQVGEGNFKMSGQLHYRFEGTRK